MNAFSGEEVGFVAKYPARGLRCGISTRTKPLLGGKIRFALEDTPAAFLQQGLMSFLRHLSRLGGAYIVQQVVHLGHDVEAIQRNSTARKLRS
jgi:hypothetical protein